MFKKVLVAVLALLLVNCGMIFGHSPAPAASPAGGFDEMAAYKSVGKIYAKVVPSMGGGSLSGTAFAISGSHLMTAGHVCQSIVEYRAQGVLLEEIFLDIYARDGETVVTISGLTILEVDAPHDICVLEKSGHGLVPVVFVKDYASVKAHTNIYIVGSPMGYFATTYVGQIINKKIDIDPLMRNKLLVNAAATGGNSGSPVFNDKGEVVGMLIAGYTNFDHLSICNHSEMLNKFLRIIGLVK